MKLIRYIVAAVALCATYACTKFDDSALWQAINKNAADIAALKEETNNLNSDIIALQQLVAALQNRDYITNCTPLEDGTGYTVAFNSGKSIVVRNGQNGADGRDGTDGKDGKNGSTPQIGVAKDADGIYYWTLNGSWLLDAAGNKVKAEGRDGGQGATPELKILEGYWYVSTDGGVTWTNLGKATGADGKDGRDGTDGKDGKDGKDGESFFKDIIVGKDSVTFVLADGTTIVIPKQAQPVDEAVDLGLSVQWASCNLGATKPEEYGGYYQWAGLEDLASTSIYLNYSNCPYHTGSSYSSGWTKYIPSNQTSYWSGPGSPDNKTVLDPEDDVAHVKLGGKWRMPTEAEFTELINNCTSVWTTLNGVNGRKFTSKKNGNSIFLPAAGFRCYDDLYRGGSSGYYWSSSLDTGDPYCACDLYFYSDQVYTHDNYRYYGQSVRPVSE